MPTQPEREELEAMWLLRNPGKPLPRSAEAEAAYQKILQEEKLAAADKKARRERRLKLKQTAANRVKRKRDEDDDDDDDDEDDGEGDNDSSESEAEEIPEFPEEIDGAPVCLGFDEINKKAEEDAESEEDPEYDDEVLEQWKDKYGDTLWIDKFHPEAYSGEEPLDAVPRVVLNISNAETRDFMHMVEPDDETVDRLQIRNKWIEEDYDPMLFSDRGAGRMKLVGYKRRKASEHFNTCSLHIVRLVQNNRLVTFHLRNVYDAGRCIPYTQFIITKTADGAFKRGKRPYWATEDHTEMNENLSGRVKRERKDLYAVDLAELQWFGNFGMKWKAGERRKELSKKEKKITVNITPDEDTFAEYA